MNQHRILVRLGLAAALVLLAAGSPALADNVVPAGVDLWATAGEGRTYASFAAEPIPAGFFCPDSKPFTGRIAFRGVPLAAQPAGRLGEADTVVRRLDDAAFDEQGKAETRIRLMALSLEGTEPIDTGCGLYKVTASLDRGEQPTTTMRIVRTQNNGGTYSAPLSLNVRLTFTPVAGGAPRRMTRQVALGPSNNAVWTFAAKPRYRGSVTVDTDGDGRPDTRLPKASNFVTGVAPAASTLPITTKPCVIGTDATACPRGYCLHEACHCTADQSQWDPYDEGEGCTYLHCLWVCVQCIVQTETERVVTE
jgi:hypothetical protein